MSLQLPDSSMSLLSDAGTSLKSPISVVSHASNSSINSVQKRLQKRRPSFQELPIVQSCQPIPEGSIPDVPAQVRSKFERRLSECPGMDCLTQTYPSKEHVDNAESVIEPFEDAPLDFPFPATWENRLSDLSQLEDDRPPTPPPHRTRRSLSLFRRKSSAKVKEDAYEQENASPSVVDLGTVATALGSSPYDAAMQKPRKHSRTVTSPTHPHQLGNALPRAKSMVNMDAETAAEFARMRSKDRASLRPPMPQRPRSYHDVNLEAGEGKALKRRPRSFYEDQPPMPHETQHGTSEMNGVHAVEAMPAAEEHSNSKLRAKATVRGQVVSQLIDKYDRYGQKVPRDAQAEHDWEPHARLWNQRRKSMGEGLRHQTRDGQGEWFGGNERAGPQPPTPRVDFGRYSGGLDYGYERGRGVGGSAGTRQLYSYASRKSLQYSHQYGVDLSDVPVFIQRA
ncbi:hypothetical protein BS50DRAFT_497433 [Corynespora cassiicola Philippines]|uniref:Uncharacterized protein n=1 Tax=Corynespora cassiicola Philippines TaxID=1448308 RepID=A0A2T2NJR0_CORCC|nr:hypothetical protein BS50DRAFT_497433 [Corynespora cassiicola Philippines]